MDKIQDMLKIYILSYKTYFSNSEYFVKIQFYYFVDLLVREIILMSGL